MESENDERLEAHTPPGNQAGEKPAASEQDSAERAKQSDEQKETLAHSLPGTNQAGKGSSAGDQRHRDS